MTTGLLLDSHVLIGALHGKTPFGKKTVRLLTSQLTKYFSPLSIAELTLKHSLKGAPYLSPQLATDLIDLGFVEVPLTSQSAANITRYPALHHHDPFDRLLLAQAVNHDLLLITSDRRLVRLDLDTIHDAYA